jgi:DNA-binding CsgD family transcriptional regulator/tetratricopeptide (TPR) repeat protein
MDPPLVGREHELGRATELLRQASSLIVEGEPGVGKSRLMHAITERVIASGWQVEYIAGSAAASSVPFGAVAHLLPIAPTANRLQLLQQAQRALKGRVTHGRLLIAVDDAPLLDDGSAALVHRVAAVDGLVVLASARSGEPVNSSLTSLWKDGFAQRLELGPLASSEARELVETLLGGPASGELHRSLWRIGRGNPLMVRELVVEGLEAGSIVQGRAGNWGAVAPLQATRLRELLATRFEGLHPPAREMLEIVAVGEPLELDLLLDLLRELDRRGDLDGLRRRHLVTIRSEGRRTVVTTAHPLYGEMVRAGLSSRRLRAVAATLAASLTETDLRRRGDALRAARWQLDAGRTHGGRTLEPEVMIRGAAEALSRFDFSLTERLATAALAHEGADPATAMHLLGRSLLHQNRVEEAERVLSDATGVARTDEQLAQVILARAQNLFYSGYDRSRAAEILEWGVAHIGANATLDLSAEAALYAGAMNDFRRALELCHAVLADRDVADSTRLSAIVVHTLITSLDGRFADTRAWIDEGRRLAERHRFLLPLAPYQLDVNRSLLLWGSGQVDAGIEELDRSLERAVEDNGPVGTVGMARGMQLVERGDLVAAHLALCEATVQLQRFDPFGNAAMAQYVLAWILGQLGRAQDARAALVGLPGELAEVEVRAVSFATCARSWLAASAGDVAAAGQLARAGGGRALDSTYHFWASVALYQAVRLGVAGSVADLLATSASHVREGLVPTMSEHARALVDGDATRIDSAARDFCAMGARLASAEAYAHASGLHARDGSAIAAGRSATRSRLLQRDCPGALTPALRARPAAISDRETDVAVLAVRGLSSREIAERLYLSRRTIDNHLGSIYRRLGVHGRDGLRVLLAPVCPPDPP